ncbi:HDL486Wp [Eremothecium sinecaudum]|uniref:HDL486Wp n=1 Tax=Eremothecium sinecaudum TaxID=45286 RepID=A0A0X8HRU9_9SACH|nr:HDL486Wp [Eremothecium sinecaudum]AMD20258.1 HDL486Wp [Eremothecium sinecaudum]
MHCRYHPETHLNGTRELATDNFCESIWKMYTRAKAILPGEERILNFSWRIMGIRAVSHRAKEMRNVDKGRMISSCNKVVMGFDDAPPLAVESLISMQEINKLSSADINPDTAHATMGSDDNSIGNFLSQSEGFDMEAMFAGVTNTAQDGIASIPEGNGSSRKGSYGKVKPVRKHMHGYSVGAVRKGSNWKASVKCSNCCTTTTPLWRRDPEGNPMCNACGLFLKLHGAMRPLSLKTDVIKKRQRSSNKHNAKQSDGSKSRNGSAMARTAPTEVAPPPPPPPPPPPTKPVSTATSSTVNGESTSGEVMDIHRNDDAWSAAVFQMHYKVPPTDNAFPALSDDLLVGHFAQLIESEDTSMFLSREQQLEQREKLLFK